MIVVLNVANVIDTTELNSISGIGAVLLAGQSGNVGGLVVADVLTGKSVPCGKLTDTWAASYEDYASSKISATTTEIWTMSTIRTASMWATGILILSGSPPITVSVMENPTRIFRWKRWMSQGMRRRSA